MVQVQVDRVMRDALQASHTSSSALNMALSWPDNVGRCAMRGSCGKAGFFGKPLPCPYDGVPVEVR